MTGMTQPIFILSEDALRQTGKDAQRNNITAAVAVSEIVRTTLGPRGMDKMLVDSVGDITITNDGVTILKEMEVQHPAAKMMIEVAKTQEQEVGDGTTTAVVLAGQLLKKAEGLMDQGIHPVTIINGYRLSKKRALELLKELGERVEAKDKEKLIKVALTAMTGKGSEGSKDELAKIAIDAIGYVSRQEGDKLVIRPEDIQIEKKQGGSAADTELVKGLVIDKEIVHPSMPKKIEQAKILLLNIALEVKSTENELKISVTDPEKLRAFADQEHKILKGMAEQIKESGAKVVFLQKGVDDLVQYYLAKSGIIAVRRVKESDMDKLSKATGAKILSTLEEVSADDLGFAGLVEEKKIGEDKMVFVRKCKDPRAVSILVRGGSEHVVDEVKRAMDDAVLGIASTLEVGSYVYGGGAIEIELARKLRDYAEGIGGKEQVSINSFADALEIIPRTLAESAGRDAVELLVNAKSKHEAGGSKYGINVQDGKVDDMEKLGVVEPTKIKLQAISSATDVAEMILRVDDIITAGKSRAPPMPPGGMGGMGGM
ncbi:MAG: TCP-1/cpn60 chaperonin family protein, partial [Candidatus Aenigmarchaeota archaeon]|nr:TCP-1/cpn60 chaperonin family protein [Candidatus Aenigmarchaeota archaeon]